MTGTGVALGQCGSLLLHCKGLAPSISCRLIPALRTVTIYSFIKKTLAEISTLSIAVIRKYVPEKRADAAKRRAKPANQ